MSWQRTILQEAEPQADLSCPLEQLLEQQRRSWELFRRGEEALANIENKTFREGTSRVIVQANAGRKKSTDAKVDPESVSRRPCFLCPANLHPQERGIGFDDLVILPNPYPALPRHLTIPSRQHTPQRLSGRVPAMLALARSLGSEMVVFYNGPLCGASAPDHFHFQACAADGVPLLDELPSHGMRTIESFGRRLLFCASAEPANIADFVENVLRRLPQLAPEPPLNLLAAHRDGLYRTVVWPRAKHRPERFFANGNDRLAISPAALEMAGVMVVAEPEHLPRVDIETVRSIYREVSLSTRDFESLVEALK